MSTATPKVLVASADMPNASTTLYTSPAAGKGTWIDDATACNHDGVTHQVSFNLVPSGGAAGSSNLVVDLKGIVTLATDLLPELAGKFLMPGDFIAGVASASSAVALHINGRELT